MAEFLGNTMRERRNIRELSNAYYDSSSGLHQKALNYLSSWHHIMVELPHDDMNSFFMIAGYHGMPFRGAGWGNVQWWGGYCHHGNVLFPTWHRAYLWRIENALRSAPNGKDLALCYWDEIEDENTKEGLPKIFFELQVTIPTKKKPEGELVDNPLHHYKFQKAIWDNLPLDPGQINPADYSKPLHYPTCRYPFSGLMNQGKEEQPKVNAYNDDLRAKEKQKPGFITDAFNARLTDWYEHEPRIINGKEYRGVGLKDKYVRCLQTPNYTWFSNTTSALQANEDTFHAQSYQDPDIDPENPDPTKSLKCYVPLESPHNDGHLLVGGISVPGSNFNPLNDFTMANGDMGENDTAGFDPIFFHHHCFVDRTFYQWQVLHKKEKEFDIIPEYPGTNSVDAQGPTPGIAGNTWLTMDTNLVPFRRSIDNKSGEYMTSRDVVDITSLGYSYQDISPDSDLLFAPSPTPTPSHLVQASGINKSRIAGSFVVATYLNRKSSSESPKLLGYESVLSRWHTKGCSNCQLHANVKSVIPIHIDESDRGNVQTVVWTREKLAEEHGREPGVGVQLPPLPSEGMPMVGGTTQGAGEGSAGGWSVLPSQSIVSVNTAAPAASGATTTVRA